MGGHSEVARYPGAATRFDRWAAHYDASQLQRVLYEPVHQAVAARVVRPGRVLDVGCGTGRLLRRVADRHGGHDLAGVDASGRMAARAQAAVRSATVVVARAEQLPFVDSLFDVVLVTLSLSHWDDPHAGLAEISRVCVPHGVVIVADVMRPAELRAAMHDHGLTVTAAQRVLSVAGIVNVSVLVTSRRPAKVRRRWRTA